MVNAIKSDCFAYKESEGEKTCDALHKLYCSCEKKCRFYITQKELSAKRAELANKRMKEGIR